MGEIIIAVALAVMVVTAILLRESFRASDQSEIYCPRSRSVVEIRDGVCRDTLSLQIVGVAPACGRECLTARKASA